MARTIPLSFVEIGPKLRVVAPLMRQWLKTAKNRGEPQKMTLLLLLVHPISWPPAVKTTCAGWQVQQTKRMKRDHNREESLKPDTIGIEGSAI